MLSGCIALMVTTAVACYVGDGQGVRLICSDTPITGLETCKDRMAQPAGLSSSTTGTFMGFEPSKGLSANVR
jgi:hypothetical protein